MDPISALALASSLISVTDAGIKVSLGLFSVADKVRHATESAQLISNDVTSTCGILSQLKDLLEPKKNARGECAVIFNADGLKTLRASVDHCNGVFTELRNELHKASKQIAGKRQHAGKVELSTAEKAMWPLRSSRILSLRNELGLVKNNLVIILSIAHLAHSEKLSLKNANPVLSAEEREVFVDTVRRLRDMSRAGNMVTSNANDPAVNADKDGGTVPATATHAQTSGTLANGNFLLAVPNHNSSPGLDGSSSAPISPSGSLDRNLALNSSVTPSLQPGASSASLTLPAPSLSAWVITAVPHAHGYSCQVKPLPIAQDQIQQHIQQHQTVSQSTTAQLHHLNPLQRSKILEHVQDHGLELVSAGELCRQKVPSVLGDVEVSILLWVTHSLDKPAGPLQLPAVSPVLERPYHEVSPFSTEWTPIQSAAAAPYDLDPSPLLLTSSASPMRGDRKAEDEGDPQHVISVSEPPDYSVSQTKTKYGGLSRPKGGPAEISNIESEVKKKRENKATHPRESNNSYLQEIEELEKEKCEVKARRPRESNIPYLQKIEEMEISRRRNQQSEGREADLCKAGWVKEANREHEKNAELQARILDELKRLDDDAAEYSGTPWRIRQGANVVHQGDHVLEKLQSFEAHAKEAPEPLKIGRKAPPSGSAIPAVAIYDFEPEDGDAEELTFKEGDSIEIVEKSKILEEDGWCRARVKGQRKIGLAPLEYLEELPDQELSPQATPLMPNIDYQHDQSDIVSGSSLQNAFPQQGGSRHPRKSSESAVTLATSGLSLTPEDFDKQYRQYSRRTSRRHGRKALPSTHASSSLTMFGETILERERVKERNRPKSTALAPEESVDDLIAAWTTAYD